MSTSLTTKRRPIIWLTGQPCATIEKCVTNVGSLILMVVPCTTVAASRRTPIIVLLFAAMLAALSACTERPARQFILGAAPLNEVPPSIVGVTDGRGRFREIFCRVLDTREPELRDHHTCDTALTRVADEMDAPGAPVDLAPSRAGLKIFFVPGIAWDCFSEWLAPPETAVNHIQEQGYGFELVPIEGLSSSARNARIIRDTLMRATWDSSDARAVLVGYSKGAPDILEAMATYPELRARVAAVVSVAGAVWGSPLADDVTPFGLAPLRSWPGAKCTAGDGGGLESLTPAVRADWMENNQLSSGVRYYSIVALPHPDNISALLRPSYAKLSRSDRRNDSQVLLFDQFLPGSTFLGYLNADHWAVALPIAPSHRLIGQTLVNRNSYPREALLEAILRTVEEDLER